MMSSMDIIDQMRYCREDLLGIAAGLYGDMGAMMFQLSQYTPESLNKGRQLQRILVNELYK